MGLFRRKLNRVSGVYYGPEHYGIYPDNKDNDDRGMVDVYAGPEQLDYPYNNLDEDELISAIYAAPFEGMPVDSGQSDESKRMELVYAAPPFYDSIDMVTCSSCGFSIVNPRKFCPECGSKLGERLV